jgi:hypothetical protein
MARHEVEELCSKYIGKTVDPIGKPYIPRHRKQTHFGGEAAGSTEDAPGRGCKWHTLHGWQIA